METGLLSEEKFLVPIGKKIILALLEKVKIGKLLVTFPDGEKTFFGNAEAHEAAVINIISEKFYSKVLLFGDIGFGEAYHEGHWDSPSVTDVIKLMIRNRDHIGQVSGSKLKNTPLNLLKVGNKVLHLMSPNSVKNAKKNIQAHYDLSNAFFASFLDSSMTYSSGYFATAETDLRSSQEAKWELMCQHLELKSTDKVLEIGSGWGGFALYAARKYGCSIKTVTISEQQYNYAKELFEKEKITDKIDIQLLDYRKLDGQFDKIVSIEMMEAIGHDYVPVFLKKVSELLAPQGMFSFQMITSPDSRYEQFRTGVDWIQKHIFPGSLLLSVGEVNRVMTEVSDMHLLKFIDMGTHYAHTLRLWDENFHKNLESIKKLGFDEEFTRKWHYYFNYCEAAFDERNISVVQMCYTRPNNTTLKSLWS
ncbi:MAG: class I SAM-dependent methyltransferase [Bacteriovoracaceae bacterium]